MFVTAGSVFCLFSMASAEKQDPCSQAQKNLNVVKASLAVSCSQTPAACGQFTELAQPQIDKAQADYDKCVRHDGPDNKGRRGEYGRSPGEILETIAHGRDDMQKTPLDNPSHVKGQYPFIYRIANTFDAIRQKSGVYIDWMFYIGLSVATILIIYQGLRLVMGKTFADIRPNMINIVTGVVVLTGVYLIIKLVVNVISWIFNL